MNGIIGFKNHKIRCIIGTLPEERENEQEILVDLKVKVDFASCIKSDNVQDTVDYVTLAEICTNLAQHNKYQLIETYASNVLDKILSDFNVKWAWIKVKKPQALPTAEYTTVELKRER